MKSRAKIQQNALKSWLCCFQQCIYNHPHCKQTIFLIHVKLCISPIETSKKIYFWLSVMPLKKSLLLQKFYSIPILLFLLLKPFWMLTFSFLMLGFVLIFYYYFKLFHGLCPLWSPVKGHLLFWVSPEPSTFLCSGCYAALWILNPRSTCFCLLWESAKTGLVG